MTLTNLSFLQAANILIFLQAANIPRIKKGETK